jgi:hypothetical protein
LNRASALAISAAAYDVSPSTSVKPRRPPRPVRSVRMLVQAEHGQGEAGRAAHLVVFGVVVEHALSVGCTRELAVEVGEAAAGEHSADVEPPRKRRRREEGLETVAYCFEMLLGDYVRKKAHK